MAEKASDVGISAELEATLIMKGEENMNFFQRLKIKMDGRKNEAAEIINTLKVNFKTDDRRKKVVFYNLEKKIQRTIVNMGEICNFPGIANEELILPYYEEPKTKAGTIPPIVRFGYSCECYDREKPRFIMYWTIQPDGRYYADDDGFGAESQCEIELYAFIDDEGQFEGPFRIRKIGSTKYMGTDLEEQRSRELAHRKQENTGEQALEERIRKNVSHFSENMPETTLEWKMGKNLRFRIPGTNIIADLKVSLLNNYAVMLGVYKEDSDRMVSTFIFSADEEEEVAAWLQKSECVDTIYKTIQHLTTKA